MKILYVTTISLTMNTFFKPHIAMLVDEGNHVDIACNFAELAPDALYDELGCNAYQIDFSRSPLSMDNVKAYGQLKKLIEKGGYDIVHCHTPNASVITRLVCRKLRKKNGLKVFYTAHGFHFYKGAPKLNWLVFYPVEKFCSRFTDKLITINGEDYALAKENFSAGEIHHVPSVGINLSKYKNIVFDKKKKRQEISVPEDAFLLLSVGELNENKNHQVIIRALAKLNDPAIHYMVAGRGDKREELLALANQLGVAERVHLLGFRRDITELNCTADVFCFPSLREGLPVSLMEAMACGTPIVCSKIRGNVDLIDQNSGILADPTNVDEFAAAIQKLKNDSELGEKFSKANSEKVQYFAEENILKELKGVYYTKS